MKSQVIMMVAVAVCLPSPASGMAEDMAVRQLRNRVKTEETRFAKQVEVAGKSLLREFDRRIGKTSRQRGIPTSAKQQQTTSLKAERDSFAGSGQLPKSEVMLWPTVRYVDQIYRRSRALRSACDLLADRLAQCGDMAGSKRVIKSTHQFFRRLVPHEPLRERQSWHGSRHFRKDNIDFHFWIEQKSGAMFRGTVRQNRGRAVMRVAGTLDGGRISMETTEIIRGKPRRLQFTGYVLNDRMVLTTNGITQGGKRPQDYVELRRK